MSTAYQTPPTYGTPLTAGQKAAATRRANRAAGIPPKSPRASRKAGAGTRRGKPAPGTPAFSTPKLDSRALLLAAIASFEVAAKAKLNDDKRAGKLDPDAGVVFGKYQKLLTMALAPSTNEATRVEANSALRMSLTSLIRLIF